ncbi:ER degradation-enhancing alpha-mannosidase-like protein 1 isoform X2 [Symsagittifera roscoffensis]|uniref:ER degradation-enhancing alpha-mannosidase-like protein 1 isoform X2 n=1 Tax=Symsagittifera roscoffensis TaxID=84072 RepID=UPI00307C5FB3
MGTWSMHFHWTSSIQSTVRDAVLILTRNYSLTLIDALDTLYVMGDLDEFSRGVRLVSENVDFDTDTNVQVFEANIRVLGGLLSAHILASSEADSPKHHHSKKNRQGSSKKAQAKEPSLHKYKSSRKASSKSSSSGTLVDGYNNELYDLALDLASRLLPAFHESHAGLPYPRVNLRHGVTEEPYLRQNINCLAGVGTLSLEFGLLSHLSGDPVYERVARNALRSVWDMRNNETFLFGNSFDIHSKQWHSGLSGLGAGMDSFYEYLIKAYVMFNEQDYLLLFNEMYRLVSYFNKEGRHRCLSPSLRSGDPSGPPIFRNVDYRSGQLLTNWIDSLQAAWPGILVLFGDIEEAICQHALHFAIWQKYSALPERFNLVHQTSEVHFYPLRPELAESTYLLYRATKSPFYLHVGRIIAEDINKYTRTSCGFATLKDVKSKTLEDRMESFVLSETFKYLYLLFDEENELHSSNMAGKFLFSTEGHILPVLKYISPHHNLTSASWFSPPQPLPVDRAFSRPDLTCEAVPFLYQHSMPLPPHMLYQIEGIVGLHS